MKTKEEKIKILERLVKEGHITLAEAFELNETEKEYIYNPVIQPFQHIEPYTPYYPITNTYDPILGTTTTLDNLEFQFKKLVETGAIQYKENFPGSTNL
jgi:hypothetical protein